VETKNREKMLLIGAGVCVGLFILNWLLITPLTASWKHRATRIEDLRKSLQDGAALVRREGTIRDRWDGITTNALSSTPTVAERQLFDAFDRWVRQSRVTEGSFKPQLKQTDDNYNVMECRADVTGNLQNIMNFLSNLQHEPLGIRVESLELTARDDAGQQLTLGMELSGLLNPAASQ
jgi:type II secretory pathway component PulM